MKQIRPWLYVGTQQNTENIELLTEHNIGAMLQLHHEVTHDGIETRFLPIEEGFPLQSHEIQQGMDFVLEQHAQGKNILIACGAGVSRSVAYTIAALKEVEGLDLASAYMTVHEKHEKAMPDELHWQSLCEYYDDPVDFWDLWARVSL